MTTCPQRCIGRAVAVAIFIGGHVAGAQGRVAGSLTVHVHVTDSAGAPVTGAEVSIMRDVAHVLARGATDARGNQTFSVTRTGLDAGIVVRKIGFRRVDRFFNDTLGALSLDVRLQAVVHALDAVQVTAQENPTRKSYFIDADEIERSPRPIVDALDIVMKLKPDMIWGRRGTPDRIGQHVTVDGRRLWDSPDSIKAWAARYGYCPPLSEVWVNGERIRLIVHNPVATRRRSGNAIFIDTLVVTVLASIKPEHIAEMEYHPCTDMGPDKPTRSSNALFVTLKDGIGYSPIIGSYVVGGSLQRVALRRAPTDSAFRRRILGVFDENTGEPVPSVEVIDVATGTVARTTSTGTIVLSYLPPGESRIRIQKPGYAPLSTTVAISPADTAGITLLISPLRAAPR